MLRRQRGALAGRGHDFKESAVHHSTTKESAVHHSTTTITGFSSTISVPSARSTSWMRSISCEPLRRARNRSAQAAHESGASGLQGISESALVTCHDDTGKRGTDGGNVPDLDIGFKRDNAQ